MRNRIITFLLALIIIFNVMPIEVLAEIESGEEDGSGSDGEYSEEDIKDITSKFYKDKMADFEYRQDILNSLVDMFIYNDGADSTYSEYKDKKYEEHIPHAPLFPDNEGKEGSSPVVYDDKFWSLKTFKLNFSTHLYSKQYLRESSGLSRIKWSDDRVRSTGINLTGNLDPNNYRNVLAYSLQDKLTSNQSIHIDSYGNIVTNSRDVIAPFFTQDEFTVKVLEDMKSNGMLGNIDVDNYEDYTFIPSLPTPDQMENLLKEFAKDKNASRDMPMRAFYIDKDGVIQDISQADGITNSTEDANNSMFKLKDLVGWLDTSEARKIFAGNKEATKSFILDNYADKSRTFNEDYIESATEVLHASLDEENPLKRTYMNGAYLGTTNLGLAQISKDGAAISSDDMLEQLLITYLQGGFGKLLQLTLAYAVAEVYEELFINFSSKYIFHTEDYTESNTFNNLYGGYVVVVIMLIVLHVLFSSINIMRGKTTLRKVFLKVLLIVMVTTLPIIGYNKIVQIGFNKAPAKVTRNEMKQMLALDRWTSLAKQEADEVDETKLLFELDKEFRGTDYNYLINFNTTRFINQSELLYQQDYILREKGYDSDGNEIEDDIYLERKLSERTDKRVGLRVDANHLMDYFKSDGSWDENTLINYLILNESDNYVGLSGGLVPYEEYRYYIDEDNVIDKDNFAETGGFITSSQIGKMMYDYYEENEVDLINRMALLVEFMSTPGVSNNKKEQVIKRLSDVPNVDTISIYENINEGDFLRESEYDAFLVEKELMETVNYGDITGIHGFLKDITVVKGDITGDSVESAVLAKKQQEINKMVKDINKNVIEEYLDTVESLRMNLGSHGGDPLLEEALSDVTKLNMYFELSKSIGSKLFPTDIESSRIESDVYVRSLVIPVKELRPDNKAVGNAALYVGATKSIFTLIAFIGLIILMAGYGLIKLIVVSKILMPALLILMIWNYIIKEDFNNKVLFGAMYILGTFLVVHWGFIGLWSLATTKMNLGLADSLGGRSSFFNTGTNSLLMCVYFFIVLKFMVYPTLKTAIKNPGDLGGGVQYANTKAAFEKASGKLSNILDGGPAEKEKLKSEETETAEEKLERETSENLKKEKVTVDNAKNKSTEEESDISEDILKDVDRRKQGAGGSETVKEKPKGINIVSERSSGSEEYPDMKDKLDRLKERGIFEAKTETSPVKGTASNKMDLGSGIVASSVGKVLGKSGIATHVDGGELHFEETDKKVMSMQDKIQSSVNRSIKELDTTQTGTGETITGAHHRNEMEFDENPDITDQLEELKEDGTIDNYYNKEDENGVTRTVVVGDNAGITKAKQVISSYGSPDIMNSISEKQVVRMEDNEATYAALGAMGVENYTEVSDETGNHIEVPMSANKSAGFITEVEELASDLSEVRGMGIEGRKYTRANANNDIISHYVTNSEDESSVYNYNQSIEGVDYFRNGNEYVSVTEKGYEAMNYVTNMAENEKEVVKEQFQGIGEVLVESSSMYSDTTKNQGIQHTTRNLTYEPTEVMEELNNIRNYKGDNDNMNNMRRLINMTEDIQVTDKEVKVYSDERVSTNNVQTLLNNAQKMRYEKEQSKPKPKEKDKNKEVMGLLKDKIDRDKESK